MTVTIKHAKTDNIADWTQANIDSIIAGGSGPNIPPGTTINDVVLASDWNHDHIITGDIVSSVTGLNTDNTDPINPIVKISVDNSSITGDGTPGNPLVASGGGGTNYWNASGDDIYNNNSGNIGIGQTSPQAKAHITPTPTATVTAANSLNLTYTIAGGSPLFTADGTLRSFTIYAYRTDVSPTIYEAVGVNNAQTDPNDGQPYNASLTWAASPNATGYIAVYQYPTSDQYVDIGNVTSITLDGSISFIGGLPSLSPTIIVYKTAILDGAEIDINGVSYNWPSSIGGVFMKTDGSGNMLWGNVNLGDIPATNNLIAYGAGGDLFQNSNLYYDGTSFKLNGDFCTTQASDSSSTGTLNNYSTAGFSSIRFANSVTITGFSGGVNGKHFYISTGPGATVTLKNLNGGSTSTNQIQTETGTDMIISALATAEIYYEPGTNKWQIISIGKPDVTLLANTWTLKQTFAASTTSAATYNIPSGTAPTSPVNGDMWQASNHLFTRLNGVTYQLDQQTVTPYYTWNNITGTSASGAVNNAYILNSASLITISLPATATIGDRFQVVGRGSGGWKISQGSGSNIFFGNQTTATGATGSLASTNTFDCVEMVCVNTNLTWVVFNSVGNITVT